MHVRWIYRLCHIALCALWGLIGSTISAPPLLDRSLVFFFPRNFCCPHIFPSLPWISRRGATVHFSCDEGYELQGSKSISCLRVTDSYVGWSDDRPICRGNDWHAIVYPCVLCRWYLHAKVWWRWCWLSGGLSFCLNAQSIFVPSTFYQVIICHFPVTGLTLTFGSHSFASCCLTMPAWCWQSLKSDRFMTAGRLRLPVCWTWGPAFLRFNFNASVTEIIKKIWFRTFDNIIALIDE